MSVRRAILWRAGELTVRIPRLGLFEAIAIEAEGVE